MTIRSIRLPLLLLLEILWGWPLVAIAAQLFSAGQATGPSIIAAAIAVLGSAAVLRLLQQFELDEMQTRVFERFGLLRTEESAELPRKTARGLTRTLREAQMRSEREGEAMWKQLAGGDVEILRRDGARLGQTLGRQVAVEAGAITAGGTAAAGTAAGTGVAETTVTAAGGAAVGELVIAGGFVAVAAAMVYAYYKSVVEIEDLKELQRGSNQGVKDFCGGYLAYLGISGAGQPSGALWKEGQRHAEIQLKARVKRAAHFFNERTQKQLFADEDPELREKILGGIKKDAASWRMAVYFSYETAVRTLFYKVWLARVRGTASERNALYARANAGLSSVDPSDEPDYSWVNAVGRRGAVGMRRPAHAR